MWLFVLLLLLQGSLNRKPEPQNRSGFQPRFRWGWSLGGLEELDVQASLKDL